MSAASDALQWAKNNPGAEATAHLLSIIAEHEAKIAHLREVNAGHVKGLGTMRKRVRAARAETEALRVQKLDVTAFGEGYVTVSTSFVEPPAGPGRHRSLLQPTTLGKGYPPERGPGSAASLLADLRRSQGRELLEVEDDDEDDLPNNPAPRDYPWGRE